MTGCHKTPAKQQSKSGPDGTAAKGDQTAPASSGAPFTYESNTKAATVSLKFDQSLKQAPDLHARLYGNEVKDLKTFVEGAAEDMAQMAGTDMPNEKYTRDISWAGAGHGSKLLSFQRMQSEYTGGAHPNYVIDGLLWDKSVRQEIAPQALFRKDANFTALDQALCRAIEAERSRRLGEPVKMGAGNSDIWTCPKWLESSFVLSKPNGTGKATGLIFLFSPYAIGPYAEGAYEIEIPAKVFKSALRADYADEFA